MSTTQFKQELFDCVTRLHRDIERDVIICGHKFPVFVPSLSLAIDVHDVFGGQESALFVNKRNALRDLHRACRTEKIRPVSFYSLEWINKPDTVRSMIRNVLGKNSLILNARDCSLVELNSRDAQSFFEDTHVSGSVHTRYCVGLHHPEVGTVAAMSLRTPIQKKHGHCVEVARMSFRHETTVRGGASKLFSHVREWAKSERFESLLTYADLRFGEGATYAKIGFDRKADTGTSYGYTDGNRMFDRFKFRTDKSREMSEKQVVLEAGVVPVWGCGNAVYVMNK